MTTEVIWCAVNSPVLAAQLRIALARFDLPVVARDDFGTGHVVALVVADAEHADAIGRAWASPAEGIQAVLIGTPEGRPARADFVLDQDASIENILSASSAALDARRRRIEFRKDVSKRKSAIGTIVSGCFVIQTLEEARNLATMLALACPHPDLTAVGLQELLFNAVEHGNLEIDGDLKQKLLLEGTWREELERRLADPRYANRSVIVQFDRRQQRIQFRVEDEGKGFDHARALHSEPDETRLHGRGIALAREIAFSDLCYEGRGNCVVASIDGSGDGVVQAQDEVAHESAA